MDYRVLACLKLLNENEYKTINELAYDLKVSKRTVYNMLSDRQRFIPYGVQVINERKKGYTIKIVDLEKYQKVFYLENKENRVNQIISILINQDDYIKIENIAEELYVSRATIDRLIPQIKKILKNYNISLLTRQKYGIKLEGNEKDKRLCYAHHYFPDQIYSQRLIAVQEIVLNILTKYMYELSDVSFHNLTIHLLITIDRISHQNYINNEININVSSYQQEYKIAKKIIEQLEFFFNISFPIVEMNYIIMHLLGKQILNDLQIISKYLIEYVDDILNIIKNKKGIDLVDDIELRTMLILHMKPMIDRLRYGLRQDNPMLEQIKREMYEAYEISLIMKEYLEEKEEVIMSDDEVGFIALYFSLGLERKKDKINIKKKVLAVCTTGRGTSKILMYRLMNKFHIDEKDIRVVSLLGLTFIDEDQYACVFTTVPITLKMNIPIFVVDLTKDNQNIPINFEMNEKKENEFCLNEKLVFFNMDLKTKESILDYMIKNIISIYELQNDFKKQVLLREEMSSTEVGNKVALPHPFSYDGELIVSLLTLKKEIVWKNTTVKYVFMIAMPQNDDPLYKKINNAITKIICNPTLLKNIEDSSSLDYLNQCIGEQM